MIRQVFYRSLETVLRHPTETSGCLLFFVAFTLVATNAVYFQHQSHPAPLWNATSAEQSDNPVKNVVVKTDSISGINSILAQPVSLQNVPVPTARPTIRKSPSTQSSLVREVQQALSELGFYKGKIDGISGSATRQAIIDFETNAQMLPDGTASYKLLERIKVTLAVANKRKERAVEATNQAEQAQPASTSPSGDRKSFIDEMQTTAFDKETVLRIQTGLKTVFGEAEIELDGIYGNQTQQAIMRFQQFFSMEATGMIDQKTMEKLISTGIISAI